MYNGRVPARVISSPPQVWCPRASCVIAPDTRKRDDAIQRYVNNFKHIPKKERYNHFVHIIMDIRNGVLKSYTFMIKDDKGYKLCIYQRTSTTEDA